VIDGKGGLLLPGYDAVAVDVAVAVQAAVPNAHAKSH